MDILKIAPGEIEAESFRIIDRRMNKIYSDAALPDLSPEEYQVTRRIIHATGDFDFMNNVRFRNNAVDAGIKAIRQGKNILVDVNMAVMGISKAIMARYGGEVICRISHDETVRLAQKQQITRSEAAIILAEGDNIGILAIGNAPTALLRAMKLIDQGILKPDLVVGVPVGFVNAAESKELLMEKEYPLITSLGAKGGTPVAVAAVNALLRLA